MPKKFSSKAAIVVSAIAAGCLFGCATSSYQPDNSRLASGEDIFIGVSYADGDEIYRVTPKRWRTQDSRGASLGTNVINDPKYYVAIYDPGLISTNFKLIPFEHVNSVVVDRRFGSALVRHDGIEEKSSEFIVSACERNLINPGRGDCIHSVDIQTWPSRSIRNNGSTSNIRNASHFFSQISVHQQIKAIDITPNRIA